MKQSKIYYLFLSTVLALGLSSCGTTSQSTMVSPITYRSITPEKSKAQLDYDLEKHEGQAKATYLFGFIKLKGSSKYTDLNGSDKSPYNTFKTRRIRRAALYDLQTNLDKEYDVIVNPQYYLVRKNYLGIVQTYKMKVKAQGARIKDIYHVDEIEVPKGSQVTVVNGGSQKKNFLGL